MSTIDKDGYGRVARAIEVLDRTVWYVGLGLITILGAHALVVALP